MFYRCAASLQGSCVCHRLQLLLCRVRGECGRSACSCRSDAVGAGLTRSGLPCVEDACRQVRVWCSWSSSAHLSVCASRRLREPVCGVAFTGAGLLPVELVEGVSTLLAAPLLLGCFVCRVASLVECCDTCLWLLSAWCWLVVSSGEAEVHRLVALCSGEVFPEPFVVVLSLRCAVGLAGVFWRVFPERCLGGYGGGSPRTYLRCFYSSACCSVLSDSLCCLVIGLCILVKVLPRIAHCHFWWRFFLGVLCVCFGPPLCCPCGLKCVVWLGCILARFSQDGSWRFWWRFSPKLLRVVLVVTALSLCRDELSLLLVGLSVLQSAWALFRLLCGCAFLWWLARWYPR
ncbi:hypothetical protein Taro_051633 [Colocasia esculenta]|uniref:Uncharacterized protein n=1 Tax=Colocasia esculenta TaxID=4460 RepID=A0A843XGF4_COLES|nr:hypothetical protein [Colocasia esculenta]